MIQRGPLLEVCYELDARLWPKLVVKGSYQMINDLEVSTVLVLRLRRRISIRVLPVFATPLEVGPPRITSLRGPLPQFRWK